MTSSAQKGGVKLMKDRDPTKNIGFAPILEMMKMDSTQVSLFTADSLQGFMFKMTISDDATP